jgi:hypothetical protein
MVSPVRIRVPPLLKYLQPVSLVTVSSTESGPTKISKVAMFYAAVPVAAYRACGANALG